MQIVVTPCCLMGGYQHLQDNMLPPFSTYLEKALSFETLNNTYLTMQYQYRRGLQSKLCYHGTLLILYNVQ